MRFHNFPWHKDKLMELNKWYWLFELLKCPNNMIGVFKPQITFILEKYIDFGEPNKLDGRPRDMRGFRKTFTFPWGILLEIHR